MLRTIRIRNPVADGLSLAPGALRAAPAAQDLRANARDDYRWLLEAAREDREDRETGAADPRRESRECEPVGTLTIPSRIELEQICSVRGANMSAQTTEVVGMGGIPNETDILLAPS